MVMPTLSSLTPAQRAAAAQLLAALLEDVAPAAPEPAAASIWTADKVVRWVDRGGRPRNDMAATITDGASDPLGLLPVAARYPGRPIFPEGFRFKTKRDLPMDAVIVRKAGTVRSPQPADLRTTAPASQRSGGSQAAFKAGHDLGSNAPTRTVVVRDLLRADGPWLRCPECSEAYWSATRDDAWLETKVRKHIASKHA
ncbi:MAG TPA: hypothetical protein VGJ60_07095 [Chloroflexota bacterium]|jgi:hypothetical protein